MATQPVTHVAWARLLAVALFAAAIVLAVAALVAHSNSEFTLLCWAVITAGAGGVILAADR